MLIETPHAVLRSIVATATTQECPLLAHVSSHQILDTAAVVLASAIKNENQLLQCSYTI